MYYVNEKTGDVISAITEVYTEVKVAKQKGSQNGNTT